MSEPQLSCIVLSFKAQAELVAAVRSLLSQGQPLDVVVVNSGGGDATEVVRTAGLDVPVIERAEPLLPGAARNVGIRATRAPYVAFLAADCTAEAGWVEARLRAHRNGAVAVASAVTNPFRRNLAAWTSYVSLFHRRMPGVTADVALLYGASYHRSLFERFGFFREDMRGGEDTEFHQRLAAGQISIVWEPAVRTAHRHSTTFFSLVSDHFRRGARSAASWERLHGPDAVFVARDALRRAPSGARIAWRAASPGERRWIAAAALLLVIPTLAYAAGSCMHALRHREATA